MAAAVRGCDRGLAAHPGHPGRVRDGVVAGLAARPAASRRRLGTARNPRVAPGPVRAGSHLAGGGADPGPRVGTQLAAPPVRAGGGAHVRAARPGCHPGRARPGRRGVGVAELRHHHRPGRSDGLGADRVRCPAVEAAGPHGPGADRGARRGTAAGPGRADPGRRHHPRHRAPLGPGPHPPGGRALPAYGHRRGDRVGQDEPDDPAVGGLVHRRPPGRAGRAGEPAAAGSAGLQGRPGCPQQGRPDPAAAVRGGRAPRDGLAR